MSGHNPPRNELVFSDGEKIVVGQNSGRVDKSMMKASYHGTGSRCFHAFSDEAGFDVTFEQVVNMENGTVLRPWSKHQKAALKRLVLNSFCNFSRSCVSPFESIKQLR
ncbi:hypothetical protein ACFLUA_02885 [Chloroflexota bacterium]